MLSRRTLIVGAFVLPSGWRSSHVSEQPAGDAAPLLQRTIDQAQRSGGDVIIAPGAIQVSALRISANLRLVGSGQSGRLVAIGPGPLLTIEGADSVTIENVAFEGVGQRSGDDRGLIEARDVADLHFVDCTVERASGYGLKAERCGGRIERSRFRSASQSAVRSIDATGLLMVDNQVEDCGANGLQVWRSALGYDGTIIRGNHIKRIRSDPGGDGPFGNAISVFRAGGVSCSGNVIREAAFSAIRYNSGSDALIASNSCFDIGETAIYIEFAFQGAVVTSNIVDGASTGLSVTNFDQGGRLAAVTGNVLRNLTKPLPQGGAIHGIGVHVEADTIVSGNAVDNATFAGLSLGYGVGLRDVVATGNMLRDCGFGIAVSVAPGAGGATISNNRIARARHGAIVGMAWEAVVSADLIDDRAKYPLLALSANDIQ